jgi:ferrochelatase
MAISPKTAIVLLNLGGPDSLDAVGPFLFNLFSDPDVVQLPLGFLWQKAFAKRVVRARLEESKANYAKIGGRSPILELTLQQGTLLERQLGPGFKTYVAMRAWRPNTEHAVAALLADRCDRIVALPLYPHRSRTTTGSSMKELRRVLSTLPSPPPLHEVCCYPTEPAFLDAWADRVRESLAGLPGERRDKAHVLFSAHGLPQSVIDGGDPYLLQIEATVKGVMARLASGLAHSLAFQSRATRAKWLEPSTETALSRLAAAGVADVLVVPIAFLTDHVETLYELDMLIRDHAMRVGLNGYHRVSALNGSPLLIEALAALVQRALARPASGSPCDAHEVCAAAPGRLSCPSRTSKG